MNIYHEDLSEFVEAAVSSAKKSVLIVSPYIKSKIASKIINLVKSKGLNLQLLTLPPGEEYITGATDLNAILDLQNNGFEIRMLPFLHAKVYLVDGEVLLLGSANFTNKGMGLSVEPNKEILIEKKATEDELENIMNKLWNHEEHIRLNQYNDFETKARMLIDKYKELYQGEIQQIKKGFDTIFSTITPHERLLKTLQDGNQITSYSHITRGFLKHVYQINNNQILKITRSIKGSSNQAKGYEVFNYQITKKSAELFLERKVKALVLILEEPNQFVCLPTSFLIEKVFKKSYAGKNGDFQFKIKRNGNELILTVKGTGRPRRHEIKHYEGKLHFRILPNK